MTDRPDRITDDEIAAALAFVWPWEDPAAREAYVPHWRARLEVGGPEHVDVTALREKLGGWDRVWRSVLVDCGAERREDYLAMQVGQVKVAQRAKLYVTRDAVGRWSGHVAGRRLNFASPADLRERVKAAERLFRG